MKTTICIAEDREVCEPVLRLLITSLNAHCPRMEISLFYPPTKDRFLSWIEKYRQVHLQTSHLANAYGWNVKPIAVMHMLDQGYDEVIWIDSDIIVNRDPLPLFAQLSNDTLVATEDGFGNERDDRNALRARLWGFPVGRVLPFGLNSGVFRVTKVHYKLMERWSKQLQSTVYLDSQKLAWRQRSFHVLGDQDVLTALLTSQDFSEIPIHILRRGKDILQFNGVYGYTVAERMRNLLGDGPVFVHSPGAKPWSEQWSRELSPGLREYLKQVYLDLSPYTLAAMPFSHEIECDSSWMEPHYGLSRILRTIGLGRPELVGLPIAALMEFPRIAKYVQRLRRSDVSLLETGGK